MTLDDALRATDLLLAFAFAQQSAEHLRGPHRDLIVFSTRLALCALLASGMASAVACLSLMALGLVILRRYQGAYNGGADRMGLLILLCLTLAHVLPPGQWQEAAFAYLAAQLILSYVMSGWVKVINPEWRSGVALRDVFRFSVYPVSDSLRGWAAYPRLLWGASWAVILFELAFPLSLVTQTTLVAALLVAALFHFANACLFGLNRFFWTWLAAYPSIIWVQQRLM